MTVHGANLQGGLVAVLRRCFAALALSTRRARRTLTIGLVAGLAVCAIGSSTALAAPGAGFQASAALARLTSTRGSLLSSLGAHPDAAEPTNCIIHSLASLTEQGEFGESSSVADVVEVECQPVYAEQNVRVSSAELYDRCAHGLTWSVPYPYEPEKGPSFSMKLDNDGNATAVLWGGPSCAAGESLISAHLETAPYTTVTTGFTVLPPRPSTPGVSASPSTEVEDEVTSSVATIVQVEFPPVFAEQRVNIDAEQLYARCGVAPRLVWVGADANKLGEGTSSVTVKLDNDGNAFVVALGGGSCAAGSSEIEASLEQAPYTTATTSFAIVPPEPTIEPEPQGNFKIEKFQKLASSGAFTTSELTAEVGETVEYKIVVSNTGEVPLTFSNFVDAHCTEIAGGPSGNLATFATATWTCKHQVTEVGKWTNEATVEGSDSTGSKTSNQVVVKVLPPPPPPPKKEFKVEKLQKITGEYTKSELTGMPGEVVRYEILVTDSGETTIKLEKITDPNCVNIAGPANVDLAAGESTSYTCEHVLTKAEAGSTYTNVASVEAGKEAEQSNEVVVKVPRKEFTVEKLQKITGEYTKAELTGMPGQTVHYEIVVHNSGEVAVKLEKFTDANCTAIVAPLQTEVAAGESATYTCEHVLTKADVGHPYKNVAAVEAGGETEQTNEVVVYVPTKSFKVEKLQKISGAYTKAELKGLPGETVHYEIIVTNTGEAPLMLEGITDPNCTNIVPPAKSDLSPKASATYLCEYVLTDAEEGSSHTNVATIEASKEVEKSNEVVVAVEVAEFSIEKLQKISEGFAKTPLTGNVGETIDYEVIVKNTGEVALTFSNFVDANCTNIVAPAAAELAPGESASYTCEHTLAQAGGWANEATVTGTPASGKPIVHTSNQVVVYEPGYTIEKLQKIKGEAAYTTNELQGTVGDVVDYEIIVKNTGEVPLGFSNLEDTACEGLSGGPSSLKPGESATYMCEHTLASVGLYKNTASIEGNEGTGKRTSNTVAVNAERASGPAVVMVPGEKAPKQLPGAACAVSASYTLHGATGPKYKSFKVHLGATGVKEITFYVDGHKLKKLTHAQAKSETFTVTVNLRGLKVGKHKLTFKTTMSDTNCKGISGSSVFIVPKGAVLPTFTG